MSHDHIMHHYRKEEQPFVERVIEWVERAEKTHTSIRTDFVDPRQKQIIQNIVNSSMDLTMFFDGGYAEAERGRVLIAPYYFSYDPKVMGLTFFKVIGENKFTTLTHRDYMGALLNIGIKREKFGDILVSDTDKQYIVASEVADYIRMQLTHVGRVSVRLEEIARENVKPPIQQIEEMFLTVSSLRVDAISSDVFRLSRTKISEWIKGKHLKVNWQIIDQTDYKLQVGDIVSLNGFGRFKFLEDEGITKKGRIRVKIGRWS
ncbi:RNA-binding protein [Tepidibacillus infernus]|uniref:YlmH family RNA-binding protein n=1 Tax=Tepidibacillus infernus TaxID=1806172 RepID=UPI003B72AA5A